MPESPSIGHSKESSLTKTNLFSITREGAGMEGDIKCTGCLYQGIISLPYQKPRSEENHIFEYLGYDWATGYIHFRCPACSSSLAVKPMSLLGSSIIWGFPVHDDGETGSRIVKSPLLFVLRALVHPSL